MKATTRTKKSETMAEKLIALLEDSELDLSIEAPGFLELTAQTLGNAATDEDGTKAVLEEAVSAFTAGGESVALLDGLLVPHFADVLPAVGDTLAADTLELDKNINTGEALLKEAGVAPPAPAGPAPPAHPGGGGSGGQFGRGRIGRLL
jgi:hypothetical protein